MLKNIMSIVVPIIVWGGLWVGAGVGLASAMPTRFDENGVTTEVPILLLIIAISAALSVLAGWLCATIASGPVMKLVLGLGVIQLVIGILVQAAVWDLMPLWYHVPFLALVVPMHVLGGRLRLSRANRGT